MNPVLIAAKELAELLVADGQFADADDAFAAVRESVNSEIDRIVAGIDFADGVPDLFTIGRQAIENVSAAMLSAEAARAGRLH